MTEHDPRLIAECVAELGREQLVAACEYAASRRALIRAGVPEADARRVLAHTYTPHVVEGPTELRQTEAMGLLSGHERGLRALCGSPTEGGYGYGKTFAAALWMLERRERGKASRMVELAVWASKPRAERDVELRRAAAVGGLVIDDLGAGFTRGEHVRDLWEGVLLERLGSGRPTILLSNATRAEVVEWMGPRIMDRLSYAGGVQQLAASESLRMLDVDDDLRGKHARALLDVIGCERDFDADTYTVGRALDTAARVYGLPACKRAIKLLGLSWRRDVEPQLGATRERLSKLEGLLEASRQALRRAAIADNQRRARVSHGVVAEATRRRAGEPDPSTTSLEGVQLPSWARAPDGGVSREAIAKLKGWRYRVRKRGERVDLLRVRHPDQVTRDEKRDGETFHVVALDLGSEGAAWETAAKLCGLPLGGDEGRVTA